LKRPNRVIIDQDGGIDDALALILALRSPELEVVGITAVSGNVPVEQAALNALSVVELLDRKDIWVAKGLANPLIRDPTRATDFHGKDGLGDTNLPPPRLSVHDKSALDLMSEALSSSGKRELAIIATGPLTNIAALFIKDPDCVGRIHDLTVMGGAFGLTAYGIGNETPVAEFNIYSDPEAAKVVFESGVGLKAVGLDVTMSPNVHLTARDYARMKTAKSDVSRFAVRILAKGMRKWRNFALHDPIAVAVKVRPDIFEFEDLSVTVETRGEHTVGMTVVDRRNWLPRNKRVGSRVLVCRKAKPTAFRQLFRGRLVG